MHLHSTFLHSELVVEQPDVLHVWLLVPRVPYPGHHLLGDDDPSLLFPSMCRGLSLVVAKLLDEWLHRRLPVRLLLSLFRHKAADQRRGEHVLVLRLHAHHGFPVLLADRIHGLLRLLLVHPENLQCRESRLNSNLCPLI